MSLSFDEMYQAILNKDPTCEGSFITAVKTTNIFCRPTCTARKPLAKNVEFFNDCKEAILHGYRPCKVCKPMEVKGEVPADIASLLRQIEANPSIKIKDYDLVCQNMDPIKIRRWFKRWHNMTFHAYQRMLRINGAYRQMVAGESALNSALDQGYGSLSGFNSAYKKVTGVTPSKTNQTLIINTIRFTTPIGPMMGCASDLGISLVEFTDRKMLETELNDLKKRLKAEIVYGTHPYLELLTQQMEEYFAGNRQEFDLPLHMPGTEFQQQVWQELLKIPYGTIRTYSEQAINIDRPAAIRAVGRANGMNRIAIIVPCHRVLGANGSLTGYAGGLPRKQWLLDWENKHKTKDV